MNSGVPIKPSEVPAAKAVVIPPFVFNCFNKCIALNFSNTSNYFKCFNICICFGMQKRKKEEDFYTSIFFFDQLYQLIKQYEPKIDRNFFNEVENCYRIMGYDVEYHNGWEKGNLRAFYIVKWKKVYNK